MILHSVVFCCALVFTTALTIESDNTTVLRVVKGHDARLSCGEGKVFLDGPESFVVWVKDDIDVVRRFPPENVNRRTNRDRIFGTSCDMKHCYDDSSLLLKRVSDQDSGIYRCRIHYQSLQSVDYVVDLRVVDSAETPRIYNSKDEELKGGYVGPIDLGSNLKLVCKVHFEEAAMLVSWRRNGVIIKRRLSEGPGEMQVDVFVRNATRDELDAEYECLAQNGDVIEPLRAGVVVKMNLPPSKVEIRLNNNINFEARQPRVVDCVVIGSVPTPTITWHLGGSQLRSGVHKELHDGNYTVSSLTLVPSLQDSEHELVCRAHNPHLPTSVFEDKVTINVGYRPVCLSNMDVTIGAILAQTETMSCTVESSPAPLQFSWTFPDSTVLYTAVKPSSGLNHHYTSFLTWRPRDQDIGPVLCRALNIYGEQRRPCTITIAHGGPPGAPDCIVLKAFRKTVRVQCQKGWDGGRPQTIHLELYNSAGSLRHNDSNPAGHFYIPEVEDKNNMTVIVYASSSRGRSHNQILHLPTLTPPIASDGLDISKVGPKPWVHWLKVAAGCLAIIVIIAGILMCCKVCLHPRAPEPNPDVRPDGTFHREPEITTREDRFIGTTNITFNQLGCKNQYTPTTVPARHVTFDCTAHDPTQPTCPVSEHSFYV